MRAHMHGSCRHKHRAAQLRSTERQLTRRGLRAAWLLRNAAGVPRVRMQARRDAGMPGSPGSSWAAQVEG